MTSNDRPTTPEPAVVTAEPADDLRSTAVDGVKWNFIATVVSMVVRLLFTFALARLVGPTDFGVVSMGTLYITFAVIVLDQGFGLALIQRKTLGPFDVGSVAWLNVVTGTVLTLLTIVLAPLAADFFHTPELTGVLRVLSITLFIRGFTLVPQALIQRTLRFREFAVITTVGIVAGGVAGVVSAALGAGYWALVVQTLVNDVIVLVWLLALFPPTAWRASWAALRSMVGFSSKMLVSNFMYYLGQNADNIIIGRTLNSTELAFYALAYRLLRLPIQMIGSVVNQVSLPIFSQMQDDNARIRSWFRVASQSVALLTFPIFALLFVAADAGVQIVFGEQWQGSVPPLQAMALAGFPMVARMLLGPLATSRGHAGMVMVWSIVTVSLQFVGFFVGLYLGGMLGVAISIPVVQYLTFLPNTWHVARRAAEMPLWGFLSAYVPPALGSLLAAGVWYGVYLPFRPDDAGHSLLGFVVATLAAVAAYALAIRFGWPRTYRTARDIGLQMARRKAPAS